MSVRHDDSAPQAVTTSGWHACEACGNWQRGGDVCTSCQWPHLILVQPATARQANNLRVLIETEFRSDGSWHVAGLRTARLPEFVEHAGLTTQIAAAGGRILGIDGSSRKEGHRLPTVREWEIFRDHSRSVLADELNSAIRRNWPAPRPPTPAEVLVSIRTYLLDPTATVEDAAYPAWLQVIPFHAAAASAAARLHTRDIVVDCSSTRIAFLNGGGVHIHAAIHAPSELLVSSCELIGHRQTESPRTLWRGGVTRVVRRNERTDLPSIPLSADAVRGLAPDAQGRPRGEFRVYVLGKDDAISADLPAVDLPRIDQIADLLLDLGSTNTKWALRHVNGTVSERDQDTRSLAEGWGVEPYRKAEFIADPTGDLWGNWVSRALPSLRRWVGREHKAYLRHVYVSLPTTHGFDVGRVSEHLASGSAGDGDRAPTKKPVRFSLPKGTESRVDLMGSFDNWTTGVPMQLTGRKWEAIVQLKPGETVLYRFRLDGAKWLSDPNNPRQTSDSYRNSILDVVDERVGPTLTDAFRDHLVDGGKVVLVPEHRLLAAHYLSVLKILADAARAYSNRYSSHEELRSQQAARRSAWESKAAAVRRFEAKSWWHRLWNSKPSGPSGSRPSVHQKIADPAKWMEDLIAHPEQLEHVVLLDAGGLSLDISVLEKHSLLPDLSHSDSACGGEEISSRIGRRETGPSGTRYKAGLGKRWSEARDRESSYADQREYRDVTRSVYEPSLKPLFEKLAKRWRGVRYCTVLLTGGGSRNPHFPDFVVELAAGAGFEVTVVDAPLVQDLITQARQFPEPLPQLDSAPVRRFEETKRWSDSRERQPWARYDKFAVVGGMCALVAGESP